ncbi:MAG: hypothetical protein ABIJ85_03505 [bacterium]
MRGHHSQDTFVFNDFLLGNLAIIANYFLLVIGVTLLFKNKLQKIEIFFLLTFVYFLFLSKAEHIPFSWINELIYERVPLFEMYRASYFKFMYFCTFSLSIMISISILEIERFFEKFSSTLVIRKVFWILPILLIVFGAKPFIFGEVARDIHKTIIPVEYHSLRTWLESKKIDFSILSLPQLPSGQTLDWGNGNYYGGFATTDMFMLDRPVWGNSWFLSKPILSNNLIDYKNILNNTNVKYIILHKDVPENYSFDVNIKGDPGGQTNFRKLNRQFILDTNYKLVEDTRFFQIFEVDKYFPHIYVQESSNVKQDQPRPILEFKKVNSTKYKVVVHGAKGVFPLVFSENFDKGWKIYLSNIIPSFNNQISNYKILDGNEENQATEEELNTFIHKGWISTLGDGKEKEIEHQKWFDNKERLDYVEKMNIDFISKNFQGTIQNDNLQNGSIFETLFKKPIDNNKSHYLVDTYSNAWTIDTNKICGFDSLQNDLGATKCIQNLDGSYDFEIVLEFWPQRLFYLGLIISSTTLMGLLIYTIICWSKNIKTQNQNRE